MFSPHNNQQWGHLTWLHGEHGAKTKELGNWFCISGRSRNDATPHTKLLRPLWREWATSGTLEYTSLRIWPGPDLLRKFRVSQVILKTFYTRAIESLLTQCISVWHRNYTNPNHKALQRVLCLAEGLLSTRCRTFTPGEAIPQQQKSTSIFPQAIRLFNMDMSTSLIPKESLCSHSIDILHTFTVTTCGTSAHWHITKTVLRVNLVRKVHRQHLDSFSTSGTSRSLDAVRRLSGDSAVHLGEVHSTTLGSKQRRFLVQAFLVNVRVWLIRQGLLLIPLLHNPVLMVMWTDVSMSSLTDLQLRSQIESKSSDTLESFKAVCPTIAFLKGSMIRASLHSLCTSVSIKSQSTINLFTVCLSLYTRNTPQHPYCRKSMVLLGSRCRGKNINQSWLQEMVFKSCWLLYM